jgi:hypothetical protein
MGSGGSCEWRCNLCNSGKIYKGSYIRVRAHVLHEVIKGVDACAHTRNSKVRAKFDKEHNGAQMLKYQRSNIGSNARLATSSEPRIIHEVRKRRETWVKREISKPLVIGKYNKLVRMLINQGREVVETRVTRYIHTCGIPLMWFGPPIGRIW